MRNHDQGAVPPAQKLLQPFKRLHIKVIGRLVEQKNVGVSEQRGGEGGAGLLTARELGEALVVLRFVKPKPLEGALNTRLKLVPATMLEAGHQGAVLLQRLGPTGGSGIGDNMFKGAKRSAQIGQTAQRGLHLGPERAVAAEAHLLREIGHAEAPAQRDLTAIGAFETREDLQQGTLACTVDAHEGDFFATGHLEVKFLKNQLGTVVFSEGAYA